MLYYKLKHNTGIMDGLHQSWHFHSNQDDYVERAYSCKVIEAYP